MVGRWVEILLLLGSRAPTGHCRQANQSRQREGQQETKQNLPRKSSGAANPLSLCVRPDPGILIGSVGAQPLDRSHLAPASVAALAYPLSELSLEKTGLGEGVLASLRILVHGASCRRPASIPAMLADLALATKQTCAHMERSVVIRRTGPVGNMYGIADWHAQQRWHMAGTQLLCVRAAAVHMASCSRKELLPALYSRAHCSDLVCAEDCVMLRSSTWYLTSALWVLRHIC